MTEGGLLHALTAAGQRHVREPHDVERVHDHRHLAKQPSGGDRGPVALVRIDGDDPEGVSPRPGHRREPSLQVTGISPLEDVEDLARGDVHNRSDEAATTPSMRGLHDRLVEPDHHGVAHTGRVVDEGPAVFDDRRPHGRPRHTQRACTRRRCAFQRAHPIADPARRPSGQHSPRPGEAPSLLRPGLRRALRLRARPDALVPLEHHSPITDRRVPQPHPTSS